MFWRIARAESLHFGLNCEGFPAPAAECSSADVLLMQSYQRDGSRPEREWAVRAVRKNQIAILLHFASEFMKSGQRMTEKTGKCLQIGKP